MTGMTITVGAQSVDVLTDWVQTDENTFRRVSEKRVWSNTYEYEYAFFGYDESGVAEMEGIDKPMLVVKGYEEITVLRMIV